MNRPSSRFSTRTHPHLYEINTWVWLTELSGRKGKKVTLGDVPDEEWDYLQNKGFDFVWLMGIWERSSRSREIAVEDPALKKEFDLALPGWEPTDVVGSPYAVRAYQPDAELASWDHVGSVLTKLHNRGMKLILDFVPNHTALDHDWVTTHPEYYIQGPQEASDSLQSHFFRAETQHGSLSLAHGKDPNYPPWTDTAQLNFFNPNTREALIQELHTIAQYCDGVRCDMAMLVLNDVFSQTWGEYLESWRVPLQEFWSETFFHFPDFVWIAEVYWDREWDLQQLGFQFTYDKRLYDQLRQSLPQEVVSHLRADVGFQKNLVRFLENHDEARSAIVFGNVRLPAVGTLMSTLPGMRLYHQGQLEGKRLRIPVQLRQAKQEPVDQGTMVFYDRLLKITNNKAFHDGQWRLLDIQAAGDVSCKNLIAYLWLSQTVQHMVVINLHSVMAQGRILFNNVSEIQLSPSQVYVFHDVFTDKKYQHPAEELIHKGLLVCLEPFGAQILAVSISAIT